MALFFQVLASGSKGNCSIVCSPRTRILLDAGLSGKELSKRMEKTPAQGKQLDGILITHEHQDHVRGSGVLSRRHDLPVYLTQGTIECLPPQVGQLAHVQLVQAGTAFKIGDIRVQAFAISHDAREPVGFVFEHDGVKLGLCTDLGVATHLVKARLQGCHGLILEANHDPEMLSNGPYPPELKQRIKSRHGHLSNSEARELLKSIHHPAIQAVVFAHLSEVNNHPGLVDRSFRELRHECPEWEPVCFEIGKQSEVTPGFELT